MAIPDYQALMLPLLKAVGDGLEHSKSDVIEFLADQLHLTAGERGELLPSGTQGKFANRVGWAKTYLTKAGIIQVTGRGRFQITQRGLDVIKKPPASLDNHFLATFSEFQEFRRISRLGGDGSDQEQQVGEPTAQTPQELLETSYHQLRGALAQELVEKVKSCSPRFFEILVVDLLVAMGYGGSRKDAGQAIGHSGDDGVDGIIKEDKLGLDAVYIQAKRWQGSVGRPVVQAFAGSLEGQRARKGILITTSSFSQEAREYVGRIEKRIVLIDGEQLAQLMIDHCVGVAEVRSYVVKKLDQDYFSEE